MAQTRNLEPRVPAELVERYGAEASTVLELSKETSPEFPRSPAGFPDLAAQLRHTMRTEMVMHLEDFYLDVFRFKWREKITVCLGPKSSPASGPKSGA